MSLPRNEPDGAPYRDDDQIPTSPAAPTSPAGHPTGPVPMAAEGPTYPVSGDPTWVAPAPDGPGPGGMAATTPMPPMYPPPAVPPQPTSGGPVPPAGYGAPVYAGPGGPFHAGYGAPGHMGQEGPTQMVPMPGLPGAPGVPVAQPPKRRLAIVMLAALTSLLVLGLAAMGVLFVTNQNNSEKKLADQKSQIEALQRDIDEKTGELKSIKDNLAAAEEELDDADKCIDAVRDFFQSKNESQARKRVESMFEKC